jgi:hypothetical protein
MEAERLVPKAWCENVERDEAARLRRTVLSRPATPTAAT